MADFLVVAARLLLIKSKALLPYLYPEEEKEIEQLEQQLQMYKEFLDAAKKIEALLGKKKFMFVREFNRQAVLANTRLFSPPKSATPDQIAMVFRDLLARLEPPEKLEEETLKQQVRIEDRIMSIQQMLIDRINLSFNKVLSEAKSRTEVIVNFLAILELTKQRNILVTQENLFADILITKYIEDQGNF
jgi:segregation and condensation protein A